jgi:hypothetical protein
MGGSAWHILTEVGWQVVEGVKEYMKKFHPSMHLEDDDIRTFAAEGDTLFDQEFCLPIKEKEQFDMEGKVQQTICLCIEHLVHHDLYEDVGKQSEEGEDEVHNRLFKNSTCSCQRAKVMCSTKCHNSKGGNIYCQLFEYMRQLYDTLCAYVYVYLRLKH